MDGPKWEGAALQRDAEGDPSVSEQLGGRLNQITSKSEAAEQGARHPDEVARHNARLAEQLADFGVVVFPVRPDTRKPCVLWSKTFAKTTTEARALWRSFNGAIPAVHCGASGFVVIDGDRHPGGNDGVAIIEGLQEKHGRLRAPWFRTPRNGVHIFLKNLTGDARIGCSRGGLPRGVDVKGYGGFVCAPGAMRLDGGRYIHDPSTPKLSEALINGTLSTPPDWLLGIINPPRPEWKPPQRTYSTSGEYEYLEAALRHVPADDRETWLKVGGALHDTGHSWARSLWDAWSSTCAGKFDAASQSATWRSFSRKSARRTGVGTIITIARGNGFAGRKSGEAR